MDRITDLPSNVIHHILERLPLRDAVKTGALSRNWRHKWETMPRLVLDSQFFNDVLGFRAYDVSKYMLLVDRILFHHDININRFSLYIPSLLETDPDISQWIKYLSRIGVKEFDLQSARSPLIEVPSYLFSCKRLVQLKLSLCTFKPPLYFQGFRNLVTLSLAGVTFLNDSLGKFITNCSCLEELKLQSWSGFDYLDICAPNLKKLTVFGAFSCISFKSSPNLSSVDITLTSHRVKFKDVKMCNEIKDLASFRTLEKLYIACFISHLAAGGFSRAVPMTFGHLKELGLSGINFNTKGELSCALNLIRSCPCIQKLRIVDWPSKKKNVVPKSLDQIWDPNHKLSHLREVIMIVTCWRMQIPLIEVLLASSPVLEYFSVRYCTEVTAVAKLRMESELMKLTCASSAVEFDVSSHWLCLPRMSCRCASCKAWFA